MKKYVNIDLVSTKLTGKQVFLKVDRSQTLKFDFANLFPEKEAKELKPGNHNLSYTIDHCCRLS